jgi:hypothetical protein
MSIIELEVVRHVDVPHLGLQVVDFVVIGFEGPYMLCHAYPPILLFIF